MLQEWVDDVTWAHWQVVIHINVKWSQNILGLIPLSPLAKTSISQPWCWQDILLKFRRALAELQPDECTGLPKNSVTMATWEKSGSVFLELRFPTAVVETDLPTQIWWCFFEFFAHPIIEPTPTPKVCRIGFFCGFIPGKSRNSLSFLMETQTLNQSNFGGRMFKMAGTWKYHFHFWVVWSLRCRLLRSPLGKNNAWLWSNEMDFPAPISRPP